MKPLIKYCLMAGLLSGIASCNDKEEIDEDYCLDPSYMVPLTVEVNVDESFRDYKTIDTIAVKTKADDFVPCLKYYVAAYPMTDSLPTVVASSYENRVPLDVHPSRYTMVSWVMWENAQKNRCFNFYDDDFSELLLKNKYNYTGASIYKLAYRGIEAKNVAYNATSIKLNAKPAMGQYKIVATDSATFKPGRVKVFYTSMLPASIHAKTGKINWWWSDISYTYDISREESGYDLLASDFVLAQDEEEITVTVAIEIYDEEGNMKARKKGIVIPLVNGGVTTVKGNFYSATDFIEGPTSGNGIHIKTEWDATFDIEF